MKRIRRMLERQTKIVAAGRAAMATGLALLLLEGAAGLAVAGDDLVAEIASPIVRQSRPSRRTPDTERAPLGGPARSPAKIDNNLRQDLVLFYSFDDDAGGKVYDESGNENHGHTVGNVGYESSFRGRAPRFTSRETYIVCDSAGINMHGWKQVAVSVWIKTNRLTTYGRIISRGEVTGETTSGIRLRVGGSSVKTSWSITRQHRDNPPTPEALHTSSLNPPQMNRVGKWVHVVATFDGDFLRLYVNGKLDREAEVAGRHFIIWDQPTQKLVIGNAEVKSRLAWYDKYFDGLIDEVKIWRRSLSADEVAVLHDHDAQQVTASLRRPADRRSDLEGVTDKVLRRRGGARETRNRR